MSVASGALTRRSVHPASPVLLTKSGPLGTRIRRPAPIKRFTIFRVPTRTLSLDPSDKRIESAGDAPTAGAAGSHLRRTTPAFAFTTPCGFRTAPRLAHMLDSLVRVSRRVGKVADISRGPRAPRATTRTATELRQPGTENSPRPADSPLGTGARAPEGTRRGDLSSAGRRVVRSRAYSTRPKESYLARGLLTAVQPVAALARR
ncbi:unnamed protein product [Clavelina lepadiformis]|uniref:Uncharacterized protein n=1 Tax=Clavelina lepadiformis TaxID=159417 RepID=A0ABP0F9H5_CLALP